MTTTPEQALERLGEIKHIVVLMMENRSFDQMLGYLTQSGMPDVRGLAGAESNPDDQGVEHTAFEWGPEETSFHPLQDPSGKILDPCHSKECVAQQLTDNNRGFIKNFIESRKNAGGEPVAIPAEYHALPMGHYGAQHLPMYDFLARNYAVCDAWHSSVPGDTWPNRLFALAGREGPKALSSLLKRIEDGIGGLFNNQLHLLENAPIYDVEAFTRQLADQQWRWYSHDPATLRAADQKYRHFGERDNFAFFDRQKVSVLTELLESPIVTPESFLDDAAAGKLREVSWIDPNFIDLKVLETASNDDHPPSDVRAGQSLVLEVYEALRNSRDWQDTLLVIVYDEHGGFYDHVVPPALDVADGSGYATYGVRVPALLVGPRVAREVCHVRFDHTSLIKTILQRFASEPERAIASMGARVQHAQHLGVALLDAPRSDIPDHDDARAQIADWRAHARAARRGTQEQGHSTAVDGAGRELALHDFQEEFARFALAMRHAGLPFGEP
jgi:phospholipase C